jgi:hypothetical protein
MQRAGGMINKLFQLGRAANEILMHVGGFLLIEHQFLQFSVKMTAQGCKAKDTKSIVHWFLKIWPITFRFENPSRNGSDRAERAEKSPESKIATG